MTFGFHKGKLKTESNLFITELLNFDSVQFLVVTEICSTLWVPLVEIGLENTWLSNFYTHGRRSLHLQTPRCSLCFLRIFPLSRPPTPAHLVLRHSRLKSFSTSQRCMNTQCRGTFLVNELFIISLPDSLRVFMVYSLLTFETDQP